MFMKRVMLDLSKFSRWCTKNENFNRVVQIFYIVLRLIIICDFVLDILITFFIFFRPSCKPNCHIFWGEEGQNVNYTSFFVQRVNRKTDNLFSSAGRSLTYIMMLVSKIEAQKFFLGGRLRRV